MKIISTWNPKGGQGKSLIAINLAGAAFKMGWRPMIIDLDPQGTALQYGSNSDLGFPIFDRAPANHGEFDIAIFDEQASDWILPDRHTLIMPVRPSRDQFKTFSQAYALATNNGHRVIVVCTGGDSRRLMEKEIVEQLESMYSAHVLPDSGIYTQAADAYTTIFDPCLSNVYGIGHARMIFLEIFLAVKG